MTIRLVSMKSSPKTGTLQLDEIQFPVYAIASNAPIEKSDGLVFIEGQLLDDRNIAHTTLGVRRLRSALKEDYGLYKLATAYTTLESFIESRGYRRFIDCTGRLFHYTRKKYEHVSAYKIKEVVPKGTHSLLKLYNVPYPLKVPRPPQYGEQYALILHRAKLPWLFYRYTKDKDEKFRRKI